MPTIEHVALWVVDLELVARFYAEHFAATLCPVYENSKKGFRSQFLRLDAGARIELMTSTQLEPASSQPGSQRLGLTHFAIRLGSERAVDELTSRLRSKNVTVLEGPRRTGDGYYESVVLDIEGNRVEIVA